MATLEERMLTCDREFDHLMQHHRYPPENTTQWQGLRTEDTENGKVLSIEKQCVFMCWRRYAEGYIAHDFDFQPVKLTSWDDWIRYQIDRVHRHNYIELAYVCSGELEQRIGDTINHFGPGDVWIIDQNCWHKDTVRGGDGYFIWFCMNTEFFDRTFLEAIDSPEVQNFVKTALLDQRKRQQFLSFRNRDAAVKAKSDQLIAGIIDELERDDLASRYMVQGLLLRLFQTLSREFEFELNEATRKAMDSALFEQVDSYLREHFREVRIQDLVARFHFHDDYFNRLITANTGLTYTQFLQNLRLEESERLLLESDRPVTEIAAQVGYNNMSYYYKIFKNKNGVTPREYRDRYPAAR